MFPDQLIQTLAGKFIVLEGIDGSGTTTQSQRLCRRLIDAGIDALLTCQPSDHEIGRALRRALRSSSPTSERRSAEELALLFAADRLEHLRRDIEPALAAGRVVICDRYVMSSWAYQSLECDLRWIRELNARARWPDFTLVFEIAARRACNRVANRVREHEDAAEIFDALELQERLAEKYRAYALECASDSGYGHTQRVDADATPDEVHASVCARIVERFSNARGPCAF